MAPLSQGCSASPLDESNLMVWQATIFGPDESEWEGGIFTLRFTFTGVSQNWVSRLGYRLALLGAGLRL